MSPTRALSFIPLHPTTSISRHVSASSCIYLTESVEGAKMASDEVSDLPMEGITTPSESDVLCARGGAALKHSGNLNYRELVRGQQPIYATCLISDKIKISRSIVAAIREEGGRFLKKDKKGTWFDIGDKAAIEKTSQALREKQPATIKKLKETGEIPNTTEPKWADGVYHPTGSQLPKHVEGAEAKKQPKNDHWTDSVYCPNGSEPSKNIEGKEAKDQPRNELFNEPIDMAISKLSLETYGKSKSGMSWGTFTVGSSTMSGMSVADHSMKSSRERKTDRSNIDFKHSSKDLPESLVGPVSMPSGLSMLTSNTENDKISLPDFTDASENLPESLAGPVSMPSGLSMLTSNTDL